MYNDLLSILILMYISNGFVIEYYNIIYCIVFNFVIIIVVLVFTNSPFLFILSKFTTRLLLISTPPPPSPAFLILPNVPNCNNLQIFCNGLTTWKVTLLYQFYYSTSFINFTNNHVPFYLCWKKKLLKWLIRINDTERII